jgi:hypothetical protein
MILQQLDCEVLSPASDAEVSCAHAALEEQQVGVRLQVAQLGHQLGRLPAADTACRLQLEAGWVLW